MIYIGIDPGKDGAMAVLRQSDPPLIIPFDARSYAEILRDAAKDDSCRCCLERVGAMPGQGGASMFNFGTNYGIAQGMLVFANIPYELVTPQRWKREFGVTGNKNSSIAVCKRLFPGVSLLRTDKCRKDHDGMAEALLMAEYARRRM